MMAFPFAALAAFSSFVAPTGRCINPPVPTRTVSPTAQEKIDAPVVAAVAAMAVAGVVLPDVGQLDSGFQYDSWAATAVAIPATICILIPFFGAVEVQEGSEALRMGMATKFAPTAASAASLSAGPWALLTNAARDAVKTDNVLMAKARAAMALSAEQAEEEERCVSPQHSLPPCHPIARVSTHSRAVLPSHDTFFTVDEDDGMACVEVTHTRTHARPHPATHDSPPRALPVLLGGRRPAAVGLCVMHELAQISDNTQQHQLRFRTAFRTTMFVFAPGHSDIDLFHSHKAQIAYCPMLVLFLKRTER